MTTAEDENKPRSPREYDSSDADRVEKKPKESESADQKHEDEDHG